MDLRVQNNHTQVQNTYKPRREYPGVTNNLNITIDMGGFNSNILSTPNKILSKLAIQKPVKLPKNLQNAKILPLKFLSLTVTDNQIYRPNLSGISEKNSLKGMNLKRDSVHNREGQNSQNSQNITVGLNLSTKYPSISDTGL